MNLPSYVREDLAPGHSMLPDPNWGSEVVHRHYCETCDASVYWTVDITFGTATERSCEEMLAWWAAR